MSTLRLLTLFFFVLAPTLAQAGLMELGFTANYRTSRIDNDNYQESLSYTGSIAYYFWQMSAIELSYTRGLSQLSVKPSATDPQLVFKTEFELIGLDFVLTFADREAFFQPFIKFGGAHNRRKIVREASDNGSQGAVEIAAPSAVVPSAGFGFKLLFTKALAFKAGIDAWTNPISTDQDDKADDYTIDYAARAGISWMF